MTVHLDVALDERQKAELAAIAPASWFTQIVFANAASPQHPQAQLAESDDYERRCRRLDRALRAVLGRREPLEVCAAAVHKGARGSRGK